MIDIETIKNIVKEFAEKYNFKQQIDIETVENSVFKRVDYFKMDNKKFICINQFPNKTEIAFGKISIEGEEWFSIEKNNYFLINILDFTNKDTLMETIEKNCEKLHYNVYK